MKNTLLFPLLLAAGSLVSCHSNALLEPELPEYLVIDGDTVKIRNDKDKLNGFVKGETIFGRGHAVVGDTVVPYTKIELPPVHKQTDLSSLRSGETAGRPFRMITIGGALSAGMRDYGWFNEGMLTSYPNIIAHQMGINFRLPLFDAENYNGIGRKVATTFNPTGGPALKLKNIVNNLALESVKINENTFKGETDNYSMPFRLYSDFKRFDVLLEKGIAIKASDFFILEVDPIELSIGTGTKITPRTVEQLAERDFKTYPESGFYENYTMTGASNGGAVYHDNIVRHLKNNKVEKGIIVNIVSKSLRKARDKNYGEELLKLMDIYQLKGIYTGVYKSGFADYSYWDIKEKGYFVSGQTSTMDSILAPNVNINLKPGLTFERPGYAVDIENYIAQLDRMKMDENIELSNKSLAVYSQYLNVPVFDLNGLYKSIHDGRYITHDGVRVDPTFSTGNFFSLDGVTPSAFGQAVIANEIIKVINKHYKVNIELIPTREFLRATYL